jgi:hypothetical protein
MRLRAGSSGLFAGGGVNRTTIPAAEVVQFGWAFGQKSFNLRSPLGNVVVHALNVGGGIPSLGLNSNVSHFSGVVKATKRPPSDSQMFESATLLKTISCLKRRRSHEESTRICSCSPALALVLPGVRPNRWAIDWRSPEGEQRNNGAVKLGVGSRVGQKQERRACSFVAVELKSSNAQQ